MQALKVRQKLEEIISVLPDIKLKEGIDFASYLRDKVPMPSEELAEFKLRPALIVSKDSNNKRLNDGFIESMNA